MFVDALISVFTIEAFYKGILNWFARPDEIQLYTIFISPTVNSGTCKFRTMINGYYHRFVLISDSQSNILLTCCPVIEFETSMSIASRLNWSIIVKARNHLPSYKLSDTKSIDQCWSDLVGCGSTRRQ